MSSRGNILLADDEPDFREATADLLRREGWECTTVPDGEAALQAAAAGNFDLLITDLEMPGNADLALVRGIAEQHGGLPIIITTGYPSLRTAVAAIGLPVAAYLTKPVGFPQLMTHVRLAADRFRAWRAIRRTEERLNVWREEMALLSTSSTDRTGLDSFLALTLRNVMGSLNDLQHVGEAMAGATEQSHTCQLINCPRGGQLRTAVEETVHVLEATKTSFKSKALGDLRHKLELLLAQG
jgi:CheY-like chemotaxis protein